MTLLVSSCIDPRSGLGSYSTASFSRIFTAQHSPLFYAIGIPKWMVCAWEISRLIAEKLFD
jgi:hypothetical protein